MPLIINEGGFLPKKEPKVVGKGKNVMIEDNVKILFKYGLTPVSWGESNDVDSPSSRPLIEMINSINKSSNCMVSDRLVSNILVGTSSNEELITGVKLNDINDEELSKRSALKMKDLLSNLMEFNALIDLVEEGEISQTNLEDVTIKKKKTSAQNLSKGFLKQPALLFVAMRTLFLVPRRQSYMATSFSAASRFLVVNGVPQADDVPPVSNLLESLAGLEAILTVFCAQGVYTTTRTHGNASLLLFWERHLRRLSNSARILANHLPDIFGALAPVVLSSIRPLVDESLQVGLGFALAERVRRAEVVEEFTELAVTVLICNGGVSGSSALDLYLHIGFYVPPVFGAAGARLALAGRGRDVAEAKYSQWAR
ncbi:hypothetical protein MA16_Dca015516 [Dendrobium catenatum]|uniref:Uncharacterized protein n=1 Tax=Dendrobium catenatum TaxID=906689 RepID=A0A2I0WHL9_9ASPA|nr:hypothetical protein MA16_Dca015516 [Dendrobium catenatum]